MAERVLTGTRVRNRRLDIGLRQAHVAKAIGISGSYLNLIEHNRRRIGARLLGDLARVLEIDAKLLEDETAASVLGPVSEAAASFPGISVEDARAEELVARFPGWAALVAAQRARIIQLEARTEALSNRLAHDTQIATSLHEVISTATAIRSTASILAETPDLDADWRGRFHTNIDTDSARLAESSQALLGFLDMEMEGGGAQDASPLEQAEAIMAQNGFYLPQSETAEPATFDASADKATHAILTNWAQGAARDAAALPLAEFMQAARALAFDPARLAARFQVPLDMILRRLTHLPASADAPLMGLAVCDGAGVVTFQKPVLDFRLPRSGAACPLWPLYQAMSQPGRALRRVVRLPGAARTPFECFAVAGAVGDVAFGAEPRVVATMLVRPARTNETPDVVGPGCRVCPVNDCAARRHPSLL
ncbi:short-chain fatty acyl-CoA regulator family protein [Octadecabacter sp. G9-8]|uniref:Short-chain fatty acyl-CoA regulator family protein n=1 Tax=Octadecabacter dasysiphoniae TaxID=2909341 RepID=A0ABS9CSS8_9RHOB|nr:XRE family transcriptional regulator [Octadecabacter dasysiphoniae]MCF2870293.1 short-chain fatty acyl-CoA regulator family protein [Octadecabacter dasysiphoniae]